MDEQVCNKFDQLHILEDNYWINIPLSIFLLLNTILKLRSHTVPRLLMSSSIELLMQHRDYPHACKLLRA